ncbi:hypothetical protein Btru_026837 [Bulinus truncatus]|nr:hypothetical protein Btru_026837 [Bulinus truncatus]
MADDTSVKQLMSQTSAFYVCRTFSHPVEDIVVHDEGQGDENITDPEVCNTVNDITQSMEESKGSISASHICVDLGQSHSSSTPEHTHEGKHSKGKTHLNSSNLFKQIISGKSCVTSSSDLSSSISMEDNDFNDYTVAGDLYTDDTSGFKKVMGNKFSPKSTLCWQCSGYASPASSLSPSSSFELEDENYNALDHPILYFDSKEGMFPDWESEHSSNSSNSHANLDDEWADVNSLYDNLDDKFEEMRQKRSQEAPPIYPHRALLYMDCSVCLVKSYLRRRVCCDFQICHDCMTAYVSTKVNEAKVEIECPNDKCNVLVHRDEINERLPSELKDKFVKFLIDANADPCQKTCPACSKGYTVDPEFVSKKKKLKYGLKVTCQQCFLVWCFLCQAPYHTEVTCKQYRKGNKMVKKWAKERNGGQSNAQKCPKCGIYIQRVHGCDHMKCAKCHTDFCYQCGDRYISVKLLGNHWSRFSPLGCKYRLLPKKPGLRKFIRGTNFAARIIAGVIIAGLGLAAGAVLVGASVVIVPGYGIFMLKQHLWRKKQLKKFKRQKMEMIARAERERKERELLHQAKVDFDSTYDLPDDNDSISVEEIKQVRVMVHRSLSFSPEEAKELSRDIIINKYTSECGEVTISRESASDADDVVVLSDVMEIENSKGYSTIVCNVVSKIGKKTEKESLSSDENPYENVEVCIKGLNGLTLQSDHAGAGQADEETMVILRKAVSVISHESGEKITNCASETGSRQDSGFNDGQIDSYSYTLNDFGQQDKYTSHNIDKSNMLASEYCRINVNDLSISEMISKNSEKDSDSLRGESNGCFGNIFSKRIQSSAVSSEDLNLKSQVPNLSKKFLSRKAATWEKCDSGKVHSLLKLTPLDSKGEISSGISTIIQGSGLAKDLLMHNESQSLNQSPPDNISHYLGRCMGTCTPGNTEDVHTDVLVHKDTAAPSGKIHCIAKASPCLSSSISPCTVDQTVNLNLKQKSKDPLLEDGGYVSPYTLVTYL